MHAIGVDIGGTKIAAGVVDDQGAVLARLRSDTTADRPEEIEQRVAALVTRLRAGFPAVDHVGVAAAGLVSDDRCTVTFAPNIAWRDHPLGSRLSRALGMPVSVENDANAAGWAEFRFGAGRGTKDMVMLTIGTGVGGAFIVNSELVRGSHGHAAEVGHLTVVTDGYLCGCGSRGCWEQYGSGRALTRQARTAANADPARATAFLAMSGGNPERIDGSSVTELARSGDVLAVELLAELGKWIGIGAAGLVTVLDPAIIVIGGGVAAADALVMGPARTGLAGALPKSHRPPPVVPAQLGNDAGLVGAADLARQA